ncbi:NAD-binding protein [Lactonifactor sp. BIOML-A3]|uniref:NAD(P)-dependent oxidoreductase n=1 Tax=unclassified Lactonifactor TaxID=2636670 RepID=UPI0012B12FD7|nr:MULTISPECIES: NAD(P)-dependent oxidoreductase [unclassified Lactonifactor]MSA04037.1 NAD-binding protein [Lactonifactor sp. BIOML-A5]MSA10641.1 NAD-binding protein [Lactonifactor sp. BIOML-A4]MSA15138.1 NAD-binding protein [Lactonifactor sp. BIOML-A3]MSA19578.1 NAD-binding protein [Lactonifactor sp. BIOML-A2]MSA40205.1 NAD-binding protein [Lactonifactor sp. BIOML-A1]
MKKIGFIGIGVMGKGMARNLMKAGYELTVYTRTKEKAADLIREGAQWRDTIAECVREQEAVITMVGYPKDVEEVYFSKRGILANAAKGAYLIDMTTTSPKLSVRINMEAVKRGLKALDAPVSGGDVGAANGTLSIMAGGTREDFEACEELFQAMGKTIHYEGTAGSGQHTKMANQIALGGALAGVCEALTYGKAAGLDLQVMLDSISQGAAGSWQMSNIAPKILSGDFQPGFFMKHYIKDMKIAAEEGRDREVSMPVLEEVLNMYEQLSQKGMEDLGTQALIRYYEK